jgi:hypothetical protein
VVESICDVLPIAPSTYYESKTREADRARESPRTCRNVRWRIEISRVWRESSRAYGVRGLYETEVTRHREPWRYLEAEELATLE